MLAKACVDVAFPNLEDSEDEDRDDRRPLILGSIGLMDIDKLKSESMSGLGWVACEYGGMLRHRGYSYSCD